MDMTEESHVKVDQLSDELYTDGEILSLRNWIL